MVRQRMGQEAVVFLTVFLTGFSTALPVSASQLRPDQKRFKAGQANQIVPPPADGSGSLKFTSSGAAVPVSNSRATPTGVFPNSKFRRPDVPLNSLMTQSPGQHSACSDCKVLSAMGNPSSPLVGPGSSNLKTLQGGLEVSQLLLSLQKQPAGQQVVTRTGQVTGPRVYVMQSRPTGAGTNQSPYRLAYQPLSVGPSGIPAWEIPTAINGKPIFSPRHLPPLLPQTQNFSAAFTTPYYQNGTVQNTSELFGPQMTRVVWANPLDRNQLRYQQQGLVEPQKFKTNIRRFRL